MHGVVGRGGFITFPAGTFQTDPQSRGTYDAAVGKWLPVPYSWIAPDGSAYAYTDGATAHLVNAKTNLSRSVPLPHQAMVIGYDTSGVYLVQVTPNTDANRLGLDLLDPITGAASYTQLHPGHQLSYTIVHDGFAYVVEGSENSGQFPTDGPKPIGNGILRSALSRSADAAYYLALTSVMSINDAAMQILGFDGGEQPVLAARRTDYYRIYTAASIRNGGTPSGPAGPPQYDGPPKAEWNPAGPARGDKHGIWFASKSGSIWFYAAGKPMQRVAQLPMRSPTIAGPCL
jgi:hypothetical protein